MVDTIDTSIQKDKTEEEMKELYETSIRNLQEGNVLTGTVININDDSVIVDVGLKSEGKVSLSEFTDPATGELQVAVGDDVEVMVVGREEKDGLLALSKQRVDGIKTWQKIDQSMEDGSPVEGPVTRRSREAFLST